MGKQKNEDDGLVSVKQLAAKARTSEHVVNDYIRRGLLRVVRYIKRRRCLADPPSTKILREIREHVATHGNLRDVEAILKKL